MREISARIPNAVRRMPDGETGDRGYWISFRVNKFAEMPELELVASGHAYETADQAPSMPHFRLAPGVAVDAIRWPDIGYADAYLRSFEVFDAL